ncbi:Acyl-CoA synthetase short-chain family member 3, mitochondrial [Plecturocebus cupreus]
MGPAEPVCPAHCAPGSAALGACKRAAPAKRVVPATRVASPPGISRSVGNKNSSENINATEEQVLEEIVKHVRQSIGPVAAFRNAVFVKQLPKTRDRVLLYHPGCSAVAQSPELQPQSSGLKGSSHIGLTSWSAMAQSWLTTTSASGVQAIEPCLNYRETGFLHVAQASLELSTSGYPPAAACQSAGITGMSHRAWPSLWFLRENKES